MSLQWFTIWLPGFICLIHTPGPGFCGFICRPGQRSNGPNTLERKHTTWFCQPFLPRSESVLHIRASQSEEAPRPQCCPCPDAEYNWCPLRLTVSGVLAIKDEERWDTVFRAGDHCLQWGEEAVLQVIGFFSLWPFLFPASLSGKPVPEVSYGHSLNFPGKRQEPYQLHAFYYFYFNLHFP